MVSISIFHTQWRQPLSCLAVCLTHSDCFSTATSTPAIQPQEDTHCAQQKLKPNCLPTTSLAARWAVNCFTQSREGKCPLPQKSSWLCFLGRTVERFPLLLDQGEESLGLLKPEVCSVLLRRRALPAITMVCFAWGRTGLALIAENQAPLSKFAFPFLILCLFDVKQDPPLCMLAFMDPFLEKKWLWHILTLHSDRDMDQVLSPSCFSLQLHA